MDPLHNLLIKFILSYPLYVFKFIKNIPNFIKLYWRLFFDKRVPYYLKLMIIGAILYTISPIDFIPEFLVPFVGIVDDIGIIIFSLRYFIVWCPKEIVMEHVRAIDEENKKTAIR